MYFEHVADKSLAQNSYVIGCQQTGEAIVIDPKRDIDTYLEIARQNQLKITHITETHIHADFLCGSRELAAVTGATLYLSDEGGDEWQYEFPHHGLKDGDRIVVGNLTLDVIHTPGHTPESICFLLTDHPATDQPVMLFTGDFVFVGDVGRPDLLEKAVGIAGSQLNGARELFKSLGKFTSIPEYVQVWPGHGAGSACGKALGAVPSSTVGYEKIQNWAFRAEGEDDFIQYLLSGQPEAPRYFSTMKRLNKSDRPLLTQIPKPRMLSREEFLAGYEKDIPLIDTRHKKSFAAGHIPGSLNIQHNNALATWMGWIHNYETPFMILARETEIEEITRKLMRIGMDQIYGFITDVNLPGIPLEPSHTAGYEETKAAVQDERTQIVDVRGENEFNAGHIRGADHVFVGTLTKNLDRISKDRPVILHCQSGDRSTLAYSLLRKHGFANVINYLGGMREWMQRTERA